jgi:hypothetical protein
MIEAWVNVLIGYWVAVGANFLIFPLLGMRVTAHQNFLLGGLLTIVSIARSYLLRRLFNRWHQPAPPTNSPTGDFR